MIYHFLQPILNVSKLVKAELFVTQYSGCPKSVLYFKGPLQTIMYLFSLVCVTQLCICQGRALGPCADFFIIFFMRHYAKLLYYVLCKQQSNQGSIIKKH